MFTECCCSLALVFLSYLLLYNLRVGCKVEIQYVVRYERYGEVEDEKAEQARRLPGLSDLHLTAYISNYYTADNK